MGASEFLTWRVNCKEFLRQECLHPMYIHHPKYITLGPYVFFV